MKKFAIAALAALAALFATLVLNNPAQAYPNVQASLSTADRDLVSGEKFAVTASSSAECAWDLQWAGSSTAARGTQFQTSFVAPEVDRPTTAELSGVCTYVDPDGNGRQQAAEETIEAGKLVFTVRPGAPAPNNGASLAGTGGPDRLVLISGVALLFAGATVAMVARRRAEHGELASATD